MATGRKASTTDRGLGWRHQQAANKLQRQHADGTPCWWCNFPMYLAASQNWDGLTLAADHSQPRVFGGKKADRLLHGKCNSQRRDGRRDNVRPAVLGCHPSQWTRTLIDEGLTTKPLQPVDTPAGLAMDW